jgi:hypothetical protein
MVNQATKHPSADTEQIQKAGWALKQRLRKQINQLSGSFFDKVKNFVFEAGRKGQFTAGSDYLSTMREIRAKQVVSEETFLDAAANNMKCGNSQFDCSTAQLGHGSFAYFVKQVNILW